MNLTDLFNQHAKDLQPLVDKYFLDIEQQIKQHQDEMEAGGKEMRRQWLQRHLDEYQKLCNENPPTLTSNDLDEIHNKLTKSEQPLWTTADYCYAVQFHPDAVQQVRGRLVKETFLYIMTAPANEIMEVFANLIAPAQKAPAVRSGDSLVTSVRSPFNSRREKR